jgi:hypothetical protein
LASSIPASLIPFARDQASALSVGIQFSSKLHERKTTQLHRNQSLYVKEIWVLLLLGPAPTGTGTIALDPTFRSFTLLEPVSH